MVYGLWFMVYGLWFMVYGLWFIVYGLWFMVHGLDAGIRANRRFQVKVLKTNRAVPSPRGRSTGVSRTYENAPPPRIPLGL